jgi:hypothetical protein
MLNNGTIKNEGGFYNRGDFSHNIRMSIFENTNTFVNDNKFTGGFFIITAW